VKKDDDRRSFFKKLSNRLMGAFRRVPKESKDEYRQFHLHSDIAQSRMVIVVLAIAIAVFGISDYGFLGFSFLFVGLEVARIFMLIYTGIVFFRIKTLQSYRSYDKTLFAYLLILVIFSLIVNATRLSGFEIQTVIVSISIFAFYLAIPTKFINQITLSSFYTIGQIVLMTFTTQEFQVISMTMSVSLLFANAIAAVGSWQLHTYRWMGFQDYAERKKSERFVVIGQTAGMVGHDIRNPLQAIQGDIYLTKLGIAELPENESKKEILENLSEIEKNLEYIDKIVADLQDYARPLSPTMQPTNLKNMIINLLSKKVPSDVSVNLRLEDSAKNIVSDSDLLRRILTNLITNAIQAMPNGGTLTITTKRALDRIILTIGDTGFGIPLSAQKNIFTPLFTTKAKGQGLGLVVVKRMTQALGGVVCFESVEGKGTKFIIDLPVDGKR
jgi:signal transduction histidine kinase